MSNPETKKYQMNSPENSKKFKKKEKTALNKLVLFLSIRDHTELELRQKLAKDFSSLEIQEAIEFAKEHELMKTPEQLSTQLYHELSRKNKGYLYIIKYLRAKGLPHHSIDREQELEKARKLVLTKLQIEGMPSHEDKIKIYRLLTNRGFDDQTIRTVAHEES
jgi:SOS response regulatory protein OraA/RecX